MKPHRSAATLLLDQHTQSTVLIPAIEGCGYLCQKIQWSQLHNLSPQSQSILVVSLLVIEQRQMRELIQHTESANYATLVLLEQADDSVINRLVRADIALLHVGPLPHERMPSLLKVAKVRHESRLRRELQVKELQVQMQDMKLVHRAKGKLMQEQGISEPRAHATMQKLAMARGQTLGELAQAILTS
ncbi:MAG TPA: ANTAR domain-containing protein [Oceanospirillaceae bacterium]|nr:ANTAR domain-containing protein [Oceanospirillaceae bacterium]